MGTIADAAPASNGSAQIQIVYPDGSNSTFTQSSSNSSVWAAPSSLPETLTQTDASNFYLQRQDGFRYHIVKSLQLNGADYYQMIDFTDTAGNDYVLTYNANGEVTQVTEPGGRFIMINYTALNMSQGSFTTLASVPVTPAPPYGQYSTVAVNNSTAYRYLRYLGPNGKSCQVAEVQFYDINGNLLHGTPFGTAPNRTSNGYANAFDGNPNTGFSAAIGSGGFCGIDLGPGNAAVIGSIKYMPNNNAASNMQPNPSWMPPGVFQGSNQAPATVDAITSVTSSDGRTVTYQYTPFNDPTLPFVYQTLTSVAYEDGSQASFTYSQVLPSTPPLVTQRIEPRDPLPFKQLQISYYTGVQQAVGQVYQQINPQTSQAIYTYSSQGYSQPMVYDGNGGVLQISMTDSTGSFTGQTDPNGIKTSQGYDSLGFINKTTDGKGKSTSYVNSPYAHPTLITCPDGSKRSFTYDSLDLPLSTTDELGHTTTLTRDSNHRITKIAYPDGGNEQFSYDTFGDVLTHTWQNGGVTTNQYDPTGLLLSSTDPLGNTTTLAYNSLGLPSSITDPRGLVTLYQYDTRGHVVLITNPDNSTRAFTYDIYGNLTSATDELGHLSQYGYDLFSRKISQTDPLGRTTKWNFRTNYLTSDKKPDSIVLPSGKVEARTYDKALNLLTVTVGFGTADAASTNYTYDNNYNIATTADPNGNTTAFTYDARKRVLSSTDPLANETTYSYDLAGNQTQIVRPDKGTIHQSYDPMDRLLSTTDPLGEITSYVYNTSGKVIQTTDPNGNRVTYTYDLRNLLTIMQYADGFKELNAYDADRNRVQQTRRNSQSRTLTYDSRNRVAGWSWTDSTPAVTLGYGDGIGDAGFNFLVHREIERGDEGGQSDENEIVIFGELLKQKAQFSEGRRPRPYGSLL